MAKKIMVRPKEGGHTTAPPPKYTTEHKLTNTFLLKPTLTENAALTTASQTSKL
jgi:hypothetical protein